MSLIINPKGYSTRLQFSRYVIWHAYSFTFSFLPAILASSLVLEHLSQVYAPACNDLCAKHWVRKVFIDHLKCKSISPLCRSLFLSRSPPWLVAEPPKPKPESTCFSFQHSGEKLKNISPTIPQKKIKDSSALWQIGSFKIIDMGNVYKDEGIGVYSLAGARVTEEECKYNRLVLPGTKTWLQGGQNKTVTGGHITYWNKGRATRWS